MDNPFLKPIKDITPVYYIRIIKALFERYFAAQQVHDQLQAHIDCLIAQKLDLNEDNILLLSAPSIEHERLKDVYQAVASLFINNFIKTS